MTDRGAAPHPYLAGLVLTGRKVVVVGGGHVAQRRVSGLLGAGADVTVVSLDVTPALEGLKGELTLVLREFTETDLDGAWYVVAATDDPAVNARVVAAADARHTFCVRADDALGGTAWTPAVGHHGTVTVGVLGNREPRKSASLRDDIVTALRDGHLTASDALDRSPGVVLVGGGPGEPELVTVAARHALATADVVVADRLAPRELLDELGPRRRADRRRQAAPRPVRLAADDQRGHRRPGSGRQAGGALQGRRQLRLRPRLRGAAGVRGRRRTRHRRPRAQLRHRRPGPGRHPGDPPRGRPRVHRHLRAPPARSPGLAWWRGTRSPASGAPSSC